MPATAQVRIAADAKQFKRTMDEVNKSMDKLKNKTSMLGRAMKGTFSLFSKLSAGIGFVGMPAGLVASQRAFMKFEKQLTEVYTLLPNSNRAFFNQMSKDALRFSETFNLEPEDVTRGMYQAISAGIDPETLMQDSGFMEVAANAAKAGVTDVKTAVDALTNVVNSYGDGVYDMADVSDQMFTAVAMSKTTFRELADYMYQILPTAASTSIRLDDLLGSISALASTGTLTRVGTTQLRQMFIELGREGDKAATAFQMASGGRPFEQFMKDGGRLVDVIKLIGKYAEDNRISIRNVFGSVEAGNAAVNLAKSLKLTGMIDAIEFDSAGMTDKAAEKVMSTQAARIGNILNTITNIPKRLGEVMKPMTDDIISYIEGKMEQLRAFDWTNLAKRFANTWNVIKQLIASGNIWKYLYLNAKAQIIKIFLQFQKLTATIGQWFAKAMSLDTNIFAGLYEGFKGIASSFVDFIIINFKKIAPALLIAMAPVLAGMQASFATLQDKYLGGNEKRVAQAKEEAFASRYGNLTQARFKEGNDFVRNELIEFSSNLQAYEKATGDQMNFGGMRENEFGPDMTVAERKQEIQNQLEDAFDDITDEFSGVRTVAEITDKFGNLARGIDKFAKENFGSTGFASIAAMFPKSLDEDEAAQKAFALVEGAKDMDIYDVGSDQFNAIKVLLRKAIDEGVGDREEFNSYITAMERAESFVRRVVQTNDERGGDTEEINSQKMVYNETYNSALSRMKGRAERIERDNIKFRDAELLEVQKRIQKNIDKIKENFSKAAESMGDMPEVDLQNSLVLKRLREKLEDVKKARKAMEDSVDPLTEDDVEAIAGGIDIDDSDPISDNKYRIRGFRPSVVADSLQTVGGGGGTFSLFDGLKNAVKDNTDATERNSRRIQQGIQIPVTGDMFPQIKGDTREEYMRNFDFWKSEQERKARIDNSKLNESAELLSQAAKIIIDNRSALENIETLNFA